MPQIPQIFLPQGIDLDTSEIYIKSDKAFFLKGITSDWQSGNNAGEFKPEESNYLYCSVDLPAGLNTAIGFYEYKEAKEGYVVVHNSNGYHLIYRIEALTGTAKIVYKFCKDYPGITRNPKDWFSKGRITVKSICKYSATGEKILYKELYLVNKKVKNIRIVVEDSIATNSFTTPFFETTDPCLTNCNRLISIGVSTPNNKIDIQPIPAIVPATGVQNRMLNKMFQFRFKAENAWGQVSEHGIISDGYFNNLSACSKDASGQSSCVWIKTKKPAPEVVRYILEVKTCSLPTGIGSDGSLLSDWSEAVTIDLYKDSILPWYERTYDTGNELFEFVDDGKNIRIKFCNNKDCTPIPNKDIRDQNPAPHTSGSVANLGKGLIFADNEEGFNKIPAEDLNKVLFEVLSPSSECQLKYQRIKVYAVVHERASNINECIATDETGVTGFGGWTIAPVATSTFKPLTFKPEKGFNENGGFGQFFPQGVKGFRAILAGTSYQAESKQYLVKDNILTPFEIETIAEGQEFYTFSGTSKGFFVQEFDFGMVPEGKYSFRILGHNDTDNITNTSTYFLHTSSYANYKTNYSITANFQKEIFIDTTNGIAYNSIDSNVVAVISDLSAHTWSVRGYIYEDKDTKQPIELAEVKTNINSNTGVTTSNFTDHNGFYFYGISGTPYTVFKIQIYGFFKCTINSLLGEVQDKVGNGLSFAPSLYAKDKFPTYSNDLCNRWEVTGRVVECGTTAGISGVAVVMGRTKTVTTDSQGYFRLIAHYATGRIADKLIISGSSCELLDCNCTPVKFTLDISQPLCGVPCVGTASVNAGIVSLKSVTRFGLEHGSRIGIGLTGYDDVRRSYIQSTNNWFLEIPSEQQNKSGGYSKIKVKLPATFSPEVCKNFKRLIFSYTKNLSFNNYFSWAADKVEFIDSAGNVNQNNPSKIKIWYRSLNEYNLLRGLNTNINWAFLGTNGNAQVGDIVEFVQDANGNYLPPNLLANVQYDQQGTYFLVDYSVGLAGLRDGVKFKVKRPYECETNMPYYEYSFLINLCGNDCKPRDDNGNIITEFILDGFNSYMLSRNIPVVTTVKTQIPATGGGTQDIITNTKNIKVYPFTFEHHSPSDTWGYFCNNGGRVNYKNKYESKRCNRNQLRLTGALNSATDGAINYLHYFSNEDEFLIEEQGWGGIQAVIVRDDGQIMLICEHANFSLAYNDDRAVVNQEGYIVIPTANKFSRPERSGSISYGCQSKDLNTIQQYGPIVMFLDSQRAALVTHDFRNAQDISAGVQSWLVPSIKEVQANDAMYWHGGFDIQTTRYLLTKFNLDNPVYTNKETAVNFTANETIYYEVSGKMWGKMLHYTPEYFGSLFGDSAKECQLFSFQNAKPYAHYKKVAAAPYLNYFGEQCSPAIGVVTNGGPQQASTVKSFLYNEVYCREIQFIIKEITTETQLSSVLEGPWETGEGFWYAAYLCDILNKDACADNPNADLLYDGDMLYGKWMKAIYTATDSYKGEFFKLTSIISYMAKRENS